MVVSIIDANDPKQVADAKSAAGRRAQRDKSVISALMSHQDGRAWLRRLLESCNIFGTTFSQEPLVMAFNEGQRNVGLRILAQTQQFPDLYSTMMKEGSEEDAARD